ncbi:MAG: four helix bundle protein [Proteobacteria bacterium]|nr:four helix bundle protein [Pseudomonadota bacterium]
MTITNYKDLDVWKLSFELAEVIYKATENFPKHETYGMSSQMRRAAISIPSNIAEGWGRSRKEYIHFLIIAYGSSCELETQSMLAKRLGFLLEQNAADIEGRLASIGRMLKALQKSLRIEAAEPPSPLAA